MTDNYISIEDDGTCWSDDGIPCPYCNQVITRDLFEISGAYTEDGGNTDCPECDKNFSFCTNITYSYTSRKE